MEPKSPSPEQVPNLSPETNGFEAAPKSHEHIEYPSEKAIERRHEQHQATTSAASAPIALPTPVVPVQDDDVTSTPADDNDTPLTANDDDLIEKEWVDKAKKVVAETKDDPYAREKEVSKLQADYLRKRYGKELGEPT